MVPEALRQGVLEPLLLSGPLDRLPLTRKGASYVRQARTPMPDRTAAYNLLEHIGATQLLAPGFLERVATHEPLALQREVYHRSGAASALERELAYDWRFTLADNDLPKVTGAAWLAHVSTGFPLLDDEVVDLSLRLPASQKVRGLRLRHFFKAALHDFLPPEILRKQKHGFGLPFGHWLATDRNLQGACRGALERLAARGIVRADLPGRVFGDLLPQHPKFYGEAVWILSMLEYWLDVHAADAAID
jgi:asparagine synthase (glutamine-hydrolysing)